MTTKKIIEIPKAISDWVGFIWPIEITNLLWDLIYYKNIDQNIFIKNFISLLVNTSVAINDGPRIGNSVTFNNEFTTLRGNLSIMVYAYVYIDGNKKPKIRIQLLNEKR